MCQFISLFHNITNGEVAVYDLNSHGNTEIKLNLNKNVWREGHYLPKGEFELRFNDEDRVDKVEYETAFKNRFPDLITFFNWAVEQDGVLKQLECDSLDLSSLTSLDPKVKLPTKISGYLDLSSLTSLDPKVKLPTKISGYLDLSSLTNTEKDELRKKYPHIHII